MVPYLRAANVKDGYLDLRDIKEMNFSPLEQAVFSLRCGDVLVTEGSGSLSAVGANAVWHDEIVGPVCFQNTLLRVRPRNAVDPRYLAWWCRHAFADGVFASIAAGANIFHVSADRVRALPVTNVPIERQRTIADFLDFETARIDTLIDKKRLLTERLEERISAAVMSAVGSSSIAGGDVPALELRRLLRKVREPAGEGEIITAYRDGQVTARSLRRADGYTESSADNIGYQNVRVGHVVAHGLDGFAGAIGTAEADGICSPVYHVMEPQDGGDPEFYGRLLHQLAVTNYLGLFATSTRERAVDFRNWALFGRIPIPVVPIDEQREIGKMIRALRPLKVAVARSKSLAAEHRQALITAAVTGGIEIAGAA